MQAVGVVERETRCDHRIVDAGDHADCGIVTEQGDTGVGVRRHHFLTEVGVAPHRGGVVRRGDTGRVANMVHMILARASRYRVGSHGSISHRFRFRSQSCARRALCRRSWFRE